MRFLFLIFFVAAALVAGCKSAGGPTSASSGLPPLVANQPIKADSTVTVFPGDAEVQAMRDAFFARPVEPEEVFRVFVTSDGYVRRQIAHNEAVAVKEDTGGDQSIADEFRKFDMVNSLQEGQIRVELYPTTGKFYRVRQSKPSIMKETDKIMSDDITRWQFVFAKNEIQPKDFRISYQVLLRKKITREQALKILSEQNKKKK
ncbi:MAG: hypothetical protein ACOY5B_18175 [Spirochaetota bacterium]